MNGVGYQTVFHEAQKGGWINTRSGRSPLAGMSRVPGKTFAFMSAGDLVKSPKPVRYLISELIEVASLCLLIGQPGAAKSFLALALAIAVASGAPWLGRDTEQ